MNEVNKKRDNANGVTCGTNRSSGPLHRIDYDPEAGLIGRAADHARRIVKQGSAAHARALVRLLEFLHVRPLVAPENPEMIDNRGADLSPLIVTFGLLRLDPIDRFLRHAILMSCVRSELGFETLLESLIAIAAVT